MTVGAFVKRLGRYWNLLGGAAASIVATLSTFVLPPPPGAVGVDRLFGLARFLTAALVALWLIPAVRYDARRHARGWALGAATVLLAGLALYLVNAELRDRWTVPYPHPSEDPGHVVVGSELLPQALRYRDSLSAAERRVVPASELLMSAGGSREALWDPDEIRRRERVLVLLFLGVVTLFASTVVLAVQASYCATRPEGHARPPDEPTGAGP